jgi:hypothetical protein
MALTATLSKYKKNTYFVWMALCIGFAAYCVYDGHFNEGFISKHSSADGKPDSTLVFNRKAPYILVPVAALLGVWLLVISKRKITAEENGLVIDGKINIAYDSIQKIDKTLFASKGRFTIMYKDAGGKETDRVISDKDYDNLPAILDHLVAKIS